MGVRVTRIVRVFQLQVFKELTMMVMGVLGGLRTLFWAFVLLGFVVYVLGVSMRQITNDYKDDICNDPGVVCSRFDEHLSKYNEELFGTVFRSMFTVFRCFTDGCSSPDGTPLPVNFWNTHGWIIVCCYTLSVCFVLFGVFNVMAAV